MTFAHSCTLYRSDGVCVSDYHFIALFLLSRPPPLPLLLPLFCFPPLISPHLPALTSTPPPPHLAPPSLFFSFYRGSFGDLSDKNHYYHLEPLNHLDASVRRQHIGSYMH